MNKGQVKRSMKDLAGKAQQKAGKAQKGMGNIRDDAAKDDELNKPG